jgi:hypothetical protein
VIGGATNVVAVTDVVELALRRKASIEVVKGQAAYSLDAVGGIGAWLKPNRTRKSRSADTGRLLRYPVRSA